MYPCALVEAPGNAIKLPNGFSWNNFVEFVLIPEVVGVLISEDMNVSLEEAFVIRQESARFGNSAFPEAE